MVDLSVNITSICEEFEPYFVDNPPNYGIFLLFICVFNAIVAIMATASNAMIIYTILKTQTLRTPSNILILGLAVSDLCASAFAQPVYCASAVGEYLVDKPLVCLLGVMFHLSTWVLSPTSFFTLTAVTADRFMAIHLNLRYPELVTTKRYVLLLVLIWIWGLVISLFKNLLFVSAVMYVGVAIFLTAIFLDVFFIWKISRVIRRHSVQIQAQQQSVQQSLNMRKFKRSVNTIYYVFGAFAFSYLPIALAFLSYLVVGHMSVEVRVIFKICNTAVMCNGLLNPIIYCWRIEDIRKAALQLVYGRDTTVSQFTTRSHVAPTGTA